jgi:hypothetical protein
MTLHGVMFDAAGDAAHREMAACFVEEYIRLGFDRAGLIKLFQTRGYAGPHMAWRVLGEAAIAEMIGELLVRWGPRLPACSPAAPGRTDCSPAAPGRTEQGGIRLPVLM